MRIFSIIKKKNRPFHTDCANKLNFNMIIDYIVITYIIKKICMHG